MGGKYKQIVVLSPLGFTYASLVLNDTLHGESGTFELVTPFAVNQDRGYILAEFTSEKNHHSNSAAALFAVDFMQNIADRVRVAWNVTFEGTPLSLLYDYDAKANANCVFYTYQTSFASCLSSVTDRGIQDVTRP